MAGKGKRAGKPAHKRYNTENRRLVHKRERVLASSHGRWAYESLVAYGKEMGARAEERKRRQAGKEGEAAKQARLNHWQDPLLREMKRSLMAGRRFAEAVRAVLGRAKPTGQTITAVAKTCEARAA